MNENVLDTVRKMIGFDESYKHFDLDLLININAFFSMLHDLGVGPELGFIVTPQTKWIEYEINPGYLAMVQQYIYLKTKLVFDRPETSYAIDSMTKLSDEIAWRLKVERDKEKYESDNP